MEKYKLVFLIESTQITLLYSTAIKIFWFEQNELFNGFIFNQTKVLKIIKKYLLQNKLTKLPAIVVFSKSIVHEYLINKGEYRFDVIDSIHVKSSLNNAEYYLASIDSGLLFQYQLLFWRLKTYIEMYTTDLILHIKKWRNHNNDYFDNFSNLDALHESLNLDDQGLYDKIMKTMKI